MGFYKWLEKDRSKSKRLLVVAYLIMIPMEWIIAGILSIFPTGLVGMVLIACGLPSSVWTVLSWLLTFVFGLGILLLMGGRDPDRVATLRLLRGRFDPPGT